MSIEWGIVMQCFWVVEIFHRDDILICSFGNKAVAVNYNSIHATCNKIREKISDKINDYPKFYMLQVMLFMTNEPAKNKK